MHLLRTIVAHLSLSPISFDLCGERIAQVALLPPLIRKRDCKTALKMSDLVESNSFALSF